MELPEAVRNRRSIREYLEKPVEDDKIEKILDAARWAPSAGNLQSVEYIIVKDRETKEKLAGAALGQDQVSEAPVDIVVCCNFPKMKHYGNRGKELYSIQESGACIQSLMLTAHSLGLGTCWVGAFEEGSVRKILKVPDSVRPVGIITLGYPAEGGHSSRRNLKSIVFKERYE
jgi:nitroreductase